MGVGFDRCPDAQLVADLVAMHSAAPVTWADRAAVNLIEQAMGWQRVAAWVEWKRLDTMRRFAGARADADRELDAQAGRFAADELALALNLSVTSVEKQLRLADDLHRVHPDLGEAIELGEVSGRRSRPPVHARWRRR
jgi:hypothetical protein